MADSIREQITQALLTRLQTITIAGGYETDIGLKMERARRSFDEEDLPAGALWPGVEEGAKEYQANNNEMSVDIEGHAQVGASETADAIANRLIADIQKGVETHDAALSALIDGLQYRSVEPQYPEDGGDVVSVRVSYAVKYKTARGDPYTKI